MKTFRHSRIASTTGGNIKTANLFCYKYYSFQDSNATRVSVIRGFHLSKLTWLRNRRNTSLTQSSDLFSRCMVRNYVSDFLSNHNYLPHCLRSVKLRCILSGVREDTVRPEVRNDYLFPYMGMGAFSPKAKLSDRIFTQEYFTTPWCILILHQISGFTAKPWSFYDIVSMVRI